MTDSTGLRRLVGRIDRQYPRALELPRRLRRFGLKHVLDHQRELAAAVEQSTKAQERLEIYFDRFREEIRAEFGDLVVSAAELRSLLAVLEASAESGSDKPFDAGAALAARLEHAMLHAEALAIESRAQFAKELGELRSTVRLTQALAERTLHATPTLSEGDSTPSHPASPTRSVAPDPAFSHVVPSFDLLYRSFEDRHRGSIDEITERQSEDYLALLGD
ncbi:MAG TPA: hypothetical protein VL068_02210, partial [Microthrixaceae bacterium]|nr:hypothetical protein [Microthrixaceae bacterium]